MFNQIADFLDKHLSMPMAKLSQQRHLKAIRDGIIATLPLIIVSSMFMVIAFLPNQLPQSWGLAQLIKANIGKILLPYRVSMFIMTLYAVFGIGYSLAKSYDLDGLSGGILSELAFMLTIIPKVGPVAKDTVIELAKQNADLESFINSVPKGWLLPMGNLGSAGMFVGIIAAIFAVEIYRLTQKSGFKISMPPQVPSSVARSFEALTPTAIVLILTATITMWLNLDVHGFVGMLVKPLISLADTLPSVIVICLIGMVFWSFGIHGWSIVGTLARPFWTILLEQNATAAVAGNTLPNIAAEPFYQWFIMIGGAGSTIGLAILFLFASKSAYGKALGKTAIVPSIFNINEPMIFGAPLVLNPILMLPFIFAPILNAIIAWIVTSLGWVNRVVAIAPWTLPGPIGAYFATSGDIRAAVLSVFLIMLSILVYLPFFKLYDKQLIEKENGGEE